jgi:hypothetical protein
MSNTAEELQPGVVACEVCLREIPRSVGQSEEAVDYVYYFCGPACFEQWQAGAPLETIGVTIEGRALDFAAAQAVAMTLMQAGGKAAAPLAWFDRARSQAAPALPDVGERPGWLEYARSHGGTHKVDINHGSYVFVFAAP